ncbi:4Fe-4S dicluster domain-containing protein [Aceticella autotrophica]|uniref:4Fe-4S dicluster domain-containing protein n=1 Tax=Aceticella autotrophica TaxID=2755338 RepID=A0A975GB32_9THEO|nr:4Fe-4S dicluster domain-containing protein [Aceticella autotrophica]QSZ28104.1 4Fe-4S dicluster domain-containing protein [Aceticella autotrophica]
MKKIYVKEEVCIGCKLCEVYCITSHSKYKDVLKAFKFESITPTPKIVVEENGPLSFSLQCRHCDDAPCVKACITGAMQKDPLTGIVTCNTDKCVGCWTCILTCGFGAILRDEKNKVASKCDLCADTGEPACVKNCPNDALVYSEGGIKA